MINEPDNSGCLMSNVVSTKTSVIAFKLFVLVLLLCHGVDAQTKRNVLFIAIDDLKPLLGCYGNKTIKTPNIDKLAAKGTVFMSNYCQQAVCGPTRASLMTGKRPDYTKVWDLKTPMRNVNPDILSLPQYFISNGYSTQGIGKVYDPRNVDKELDGPSWSVPYYKKADKYYAAETGAPALGQYQDPQTKKLAAKYLAEAKEKGLSDEDGRENANGKVKPSVEVADVPDNAYTDGANALQAKDILVKLSKKNEPFFFAVGFSKPHLPFVAPKKYWDLYDREQMPIEPFQQASANGVDLAYHNSSELMAYSDIPSLATFSDQKAGLSLPLNKQKELIHGYHAAVSYTDAQVGILLRTLDSLGLTKNTIIVLWGDHGWHLGDHNLWCKHTNFEQATHAPLIISAPGIAPSVVKSPSEFVDIFPTLCELVDVKIPAHLDGKSLVTAMKKPATIVKEFAVSQYPRSGTKREKGRLGYAEGQCMGYSIRTQRYRYTMWMKDGYRSTDAYNKNLLVGTELYDYDKDPKETVNVANKKEYATAVKKLDSYMKSFFETEYKKAHSKKNIF